MATHPLDRPFGKGVVWETSGTCEYDLWRMVCVYIYRLAQITSSGNIQVKILKSRT